MKYYAISEMTVERKGVDVIVEISGDVHYHVDAYYGEDADGNRGMSRIFVDDVIGLTAMGMTNADDLELTKDEKEEAEEILIRKFLEG